MAFTMAMDLQTLFGLILYFALSPLMKAVFADFGAAMANSTLRYWSMEHIFGMVVALALAHVGRARSRKAFEAVARHKEMAIFCGLAILVILVTIPWPFMPYTPERPWFRVG
jgi:hypothetical protein